MLVLVGGIGVETDYGPLGQHYFSSAVIDGHFPCVEVLLLYSAVAVSSIIGHLVLERYHGACAGSVRRCSGTHRGSVRDVWGPVHIR